MIITIVECDYCQDNLRGYPEVHVCEVEDINDECVSTLHLCPSCYKYYVFDHPEEAGIELRNHQISTADKILYGDELKDQ